MATPIIMPKFGQMTEESAIVEWLKKEGDKVDKGDILFTVETDKSVMEVESFEEGTLLKIMVPPGVNVPVQSVVGYLGQPGETVPTAPTRPRRRARRPPRKPPRRRRARRRADRSSRLALAVGACGAVSRRAGHVSASARARRRSPRKA